VDNRAEIREFLATRRAKITPEQAGLPSGGGRRRVPGLRREEVAVLAGVSTRWYVRLEKGHIAGVSDDVLDAVARALQLDEAERNHLFNLARAAKPGRAPARRLHRAGVEHFRHPVVGTLDLACDSMDLPAQPGLTLTAYTAEPGSPSQDALTLLPAGPPPNPRLRRPTRPPADRRGRTPTTTGASVLRYAIVKEQQ
jgi:transcriptional regulator with XRE-family HTH domain